jgi:hypothetical protein
MVEWSVRLGLSTATFAHYRRIGKSLTALEVLRQFPLVCYHFPYITPKAAEILSADRELLSTLYKDLRTFGDLTENGRKALGRTKLIVGHFCEKPLVDHFYTLSTQVDASSLDVMVMADRGDNLTLGTVAAYFEALHAVKLDVITDVRLNPFQLNRLLELVYLETAMPILNRLTHLDVVDPDPAKRLEVEYFKSDWRESARIRADLLDQSTEVVIKAFLDSWQRLRHPGN